mgnify:CR=1 FL=1
MDDIDLTKFNIGIASVNAGMAGIGVLKNQPDVIAVNSGLFAFNMSLALMTGRDALKDFAGEVPRKVKEQAYDGVVRGQVENRIGEVSDEIKGGRGRRKAFTGGFSGSFGRSVEA